MKKILEVNNTNKPFAINNLTCEDIIVTRYKNETINTKEGLLTKRVPQEINITKKVNETKKIVLGETAQEKLAKMQKILEEIK